MMLSMNAIPRMLALQASSKPTGMYLVNVCCTLPNLPALGIRAGLNFEHCKGNHVIAKERMQVVCAEFVQLLDPLYAY